MTTSKWEITVNIPGLPELAQALTALAEKAAGVPDACSVEKPRQTVVQPEAVPAAEPVPQPVEPVPQPAESATAAVPTAVPRDYTLDDLARAAMPLMDTHMADLQRLLQSFGVEALPNLPKEQYGAFATALRGMGGRI